MTTKTLYLRNGSTETILSVDDFKDFLDRCVSPDTVEIIDELIAKGEKAEVALNSDLDSYEASLDSNTTCFNDLLEQVEYLQKLLSSQRLDRKKIHQVVEYMKREILNQI